MVNRSELFGIKNIFNYFENNRYNVVLCAIAKNENLYINEWINYHLTLGIDHIYLYDNNDSTAPNIKNFITNKDKVTIINYQNKHYKKMQTVVYTEFYKRYNKMFNWCGFLDIDEFLSGVNNVNEFFNSEKFTNYNQIRIKWKLFGDDGCIDRDRSIPVHDFFKHPILDNFKSNEAKCFIRGNMPEQLSYHKTHYVLNEKKELWKACLPSGNPTTIVDWSIHEDYSNETIFINHYMTKTLSEFIDQKLNRGDVVKPDINLTLDYYWQINEKTEEKLNWLKNIAKLNSTI